MSEPCPIRRGERYGTCGDEGAPGTVEQKQLDELNIACVAPAEE